MMYCAPRVKCCNCHSAPVQADRYKTRMCDKFLMFGMCPYSFRCMFAHGAEELRTPEDNIRDNLLTEEAIRQFRIQYYGLQPQVCEDRPADFGPFKSYTPMEEGSSCAASSLCSASGYKRCCPPPYSMAASTEYRHHPYFNVLDEPPMYGSAMEDFDSMADEKFGESPDYSTAIKKAAWDGSDTSSQISVEHGIELP